MNDILFNVLKAVIILVIGAVMRYFIPWLKEVVEKSKFSGVLKWVTVFVEAAEQTIVGGSDKKTYVIEKLKALLVSKNIALSDDQIDALVESTVNELFPSTVDNTDNTVDNSVETAENNASTDNVDSVD